MGIGRVRIALAIVSLGVATTAIGERSSRAQIPGIPTSFPTAPWGAVPGFGGGAAPQTGPVATGPALFPRGLDPIDPAVYLKVVEAFAPSMGNLPSSSDMGSSFPPVSSQGAQGSCVAWAVAYGLKSFQEREERGWAYTPDHLFSPASIFNKYKKGKCNGGWYVKDALEMVEADGVAPMSAMPYSASDCSALPDEATKTLSKNYRIHSIRRVPNDAIEIKGHIATRMPVVIGMRVDPSFDYLKGQQVYPGATGSYDGGHAMVIVGYDDTKQAFRLFNSWGKGWGDGGFGWVSYTALVKQATELYVARDFNASPTPNPTPGPNPTPTPAPKPAYGAPKATLAAPTTMKNILVGDTYYFGLSVAGKIQNAQNRKFELVVRFRRGGAPIASKDPKYRDAHGYLAAGTPKQPITTQEFQLGGAPSVAIPQGSLKQSLGAISGDQVEVEMYYDAYVDGFHVGRSPSAKVTFKWN